MEEVLRYVLLHSPRRRNRVLPLSIDAASTSLGQRLVSLRSGDDSRTRMLDAATSFLRSADFAALLGRPPLHPELMSLRRALQALDPAIPVTLVQLADMVRGAFSAPAQRVVAGAAFSSMRIRLTEGILALKLRPDMHPGLIAELVWLWRMWDIVDRVGRSDPELNDVLPRALLGRTVQLPSAIFPLSQRRSRSTNAPPTADSQPREDGASTERSLTTRLHDTQAAVRELHALSRAVRATGGGTTEPRTIDPARLSTRTRQLLARLSLNEAEAADDATIARVRAEAQMLTAQARAVSEEQPAVSFVRIAGTTLPSHAVGAFDLGIADGPSVPTSVGEVRPSGVGSLLVVTQRIKRYEAMEISHTHNVLRGESSLRDTRRLSRTEESFTTEAEQTREEERSFQSTDRRDLKNEVEATVKQDENFKLGATISVSYGKVFESEVSTEYATSNAQEQTTRAATSLAREVVDRAASKVSDRIRTEHTLKTLEEFEEKNHIGFNNTAGDEHVIGLYQWLDRIYEAQVYDYGIRLFFDVMLPEPAAYLLHALALRSGTPEGLRRPPLFSLRPDEIDEDDNGNGTSYLELVARYQVSGVEPPPARTTTFSWTVSMPESMASNDDLEEGMSLRRFESLEIPQGYQTVSANYQISRRVFSGHFPFMELHIGGVHVFPFDLTMVMPTDPEDFSPTMSTNMMDLDAQTGTMAFGLYAQFVVELMLIVRVRCERTAEAYAAWQAKTHTAILHAYLALEASYQDRLAALASQQGVRPEGRNPAENRAIERAELKRLCISTLTGQHFNLFSAVLQSGSYAPRIDFDEAAAEGAYARFFESAYEWENMTYEFYPYYWARRSTWIDRLLLSDVDSLHAEFLKAGYARVRIPVRPDFEKAVFHYLETGEVWSSGELPDLVTPDYIDLLEEVMERREPRSLRIPVGEPWDIRLPTTLVRLKPTSELPVWQQDADGVWVPAPETPDP